MKPIVHTAIAMVLAAAALLGAAAVDADGAHAVTYTVGDGMTYSVSAPDGPYILKTLDELGHCPAGYKFVGWETADGTVLAPGSVVNLSEDVSLLARLSILTYTADYVADGQTIFTDSWTVETVDEPAEVPADPSKDGAIFRGWDSAPARGLSDRVYTAVFTPDYAVTYVVDGITVLTTCLSEGAVPADPSKDGAVFVGWIPSLESADGDLVRTAVWRSDVVTVTWTAGGEEVAQTSVRYGQPAVAPALPDGYTGWTYKGGPVTRDCAFAAVPAEQVPVHALRYIVDGTTVFECDTASAVTAPTDPSKTGFEFVGWDASVGPDGDVTYTAAWRAAVSTVTFVAGGETLATVSVLYGDTVTAPAVDMPPGYAGWDFDFSTPIVGDVTVGALELPPAKPTGLADPVVQTCLIIVLVLGLAAAALVYKLGKDGRLKRPSKKDVKNGEPPKEGGTQ